MGTATHADTVATMALLDETRLFPLACAIAFVACDLFTDVLFLLFGQEVDHNIQQLFFFTFTDLLF